MKITLYLLMFFITLISCNRHIYNKHSLISKMPKISTKDSNILLQTKVIGDWGIYVTISGGMSSSCNVCPQIIFNDNGSAKIIFPTLTGDEEQMKWQIKNNILEILYSSDSKNHYFRDREYKLKFEEKKGYLELKLSNVVSENVYILRR